VSDDREKLGEASGDGDADYGAMLGGEVVTRLIVANEGKLAIFESMACV
jgi:hypothetical protein